MPKERLKESIARNRENNKSSHDRGVSATIAANAQAVAMPTQKSAKTDRKTVLTAFRLIRLL
jgi:predicted lipoprotein with Yx(FWY)xxD motif